MDVGPETAANRSRAAPPSGPPSRLARNVVIGMVGGAVPGGEPRQHRPRVVRRQVPGAADRLQLQQPQPGAGQRRARRLDLLPRRVPPPAHLRSALLPARPVVRRRRHPLDGAPLPMYGRMLRTAEGWFKKASYPVIAIAPNNYFCLFAGASGMPIAGFLIANVGRDRGAAVPAAQLRQPVRRAAGGGPRTSSPTTACSSSPSAWWRSPRPCGLTADQAARSTASSSSTARSQPTVRTVRKTPNRSRGAGRGRR